MTEKALKIIQGALQVFMTYGLKSVNMDDMARHLGISKKTLYLYVKDKEDLVHKALDYYFQSEGDSIREISHRGLNAIDESFEIMKWVLHILRHIHPSVSYDLEKYFPEAFQKLKTSRHLLVSECMVMNMKKGQKEGLYRKDFDIHIIAKFYFLRMDMLLAQEHFPASDYKIITLYKELFQYHIRGIASPKGQSYLDKKFKSFKH